MNQATSETQAEDSTPKGPEDDVPMSFFDHLAELRTRLIRSAVALTVAVGICYAAVDYLTQFILWPYFRAWTELNARCLARDGEYCLPETGPQLQNLTAFESVVTDIRIAVFGGLFLAAPFLFYHIWMFVSPGLYRSERRLVVPFVGMSALMFLAGGAFCYTFVLPIATDFLLEYPLRKNIGDGVRIVTNYTYSDYVQYTTKLLLAFALMFEFPMAVFFLAKAGLITHKTLLRYWKPMVLVFFVVGAILTPPEPITQILMAVPMTGLYFASIGVAYFAGKPELERLQKLEEELAAAEADEESQEQGESTQALAPLSTDAQDARRVPAVPANGETGSESPPT